MNFILQRDAYLADGIFGELFIEGTDSPFCVTLEHAYNYKGEYVPKIPPGNYECRRRQSPKFSREVFEVCSVPNHTDIEIHFGNYNHDSDGCILLGKSVQFMDSGARAISFSRNTFDKFMNLLADQDTFLLTVL